MASDFIMSDEERQANRLPCKCEEAKNDQYEIHSVNSDYGIYYHEGLGWLMVVKYPIPGGEDEKEIHMNFCIICGKDLRVK